MWIAIIMILISASPAWAQQSDWKSAWNKILAGARQEGKVVVAGPPDPVVRQELPLKFRTRFGISMEYIGGRGSDIAARLRNERAAGISTIDAFLTGLPTIVSILHAEKMLEPVKSTFILPEVLDGSNWKQGTLWFADPEATYVLRLFRFVSPMFFLNTQHARSEEFRSINDLLNPKWKGKISGSDPTVSGAGAGTAVHFYSALGEEFLKKLYIDQHPAITRNDRDMADWLARGTHPISLNAREEDVLRLQKDGFPIQAVYAMPDALGKVSGGTGFLSLMNGSPHPNAARVFANWIASKEGLEVYAKGYSSATLRKDVDESFLPPEVIPRAGVNYFDNGTWKVAVSESQIRGRVKDILGK